MASISVATAGASVALYFFSRRFTVCGFGGGSTDEAAGVPQRLAFKNAHKPPNSWLEALFFFAEALRYMYGETLGRWRTADLLIGLAYLAQRESEEHPCADIAEHGRMLGLGLSTADRAALAAELRGVQRCMRYCRSLRERKAAAQAAVLRSMGVDAADIRVQKPLAGVLKPCYVIVRDRQLHAVVLAIRGTHSLKDMFTSLTGASKPHHIVDGAGVVLGYSHFGMLAAARWLLQETAGELSAALADSPGFALRIVGHSLGGGTAALLTMMLRDAAPEFAEATCLAIACPACMTLELAKSCTGYVTTIINNTDIVPNISPGAADTLREEVVRSAWYEAFRADMRSSVIVRAVESSLGRMGHATSWTTARLASASQTFMACYRRVPAKRRSSEMPEAGGGAAKRVDTGMLAGALDRDSPADIEFARNWVPQDLQGSDSDGWAQALSAVQPITGVPAAPSTGLSWGRRVAEQLSSSSAGFFRRWTRSAKPGTPPAPRDDAAPLPEVAAHYASSQLDAPSPLPEMTVEASDGSEEEGVFERTQLPTEQELLEGILAVQAAVAAAEREQGDTGDLPHHKEPRPSNPGIFLGVAGQDTAMGMEWEAPGDFGGLTEEEWKRATYPAGRIMHLVPSHLMSGPLPYSRQKPVHGSQDVAASLDPSKASAAAEASTVRQRTGFAHEAKRRAAEDDLLEQQTLQASMAGVDGCVVILSDTTPTEADELEAPAEPEQFVLLDGIPQEVYSRVKLCKTMVADHFIPSYLAALNTVVEALEQQNADS